MSKTETVSNVGANLMARTTQERLTADLQAARGDLDELQRGMEEARGRDFEKFEFGGSVDFQRQMRRVIDLQEALVGAVIIEPRQDVTEVGLGNNVVVIFDGETEATELSVLGPKDCKGCEGVVSYDSPLGSSLMGGKPGQVVEYAVKSKTGETTFRATIVNILPGNFEAVVSPMVSATA